MLRLWDTRTGKQLLARSAHGTCLSFSRDDRLLAADQGAGKIRLFHCRTGDEVRSLVQRTEFGSDRYRGNAALGSDGERLAVAASDGVALVDLGRGAETDMLPFAGYQPLRFESDNEALWMYGRRGLLRWLFHPEAEGAAHYSELPGAISTNLANTDCGSSADAQVVCFAKFGEGAVLWRRNSNSTIALKPQDDVRHCAVSPGGKWVATGSHSLKTGPGAKIWDGLTGRHKTDLPVGEFCRVRFSPDGHWLVTTGGAPRIWETGTWKEGPKLPGATFIDADVAFTADGRLLALAGDPGIVMLVRTDAGEELARLTAPEPTRLVPLVFTRDEGQLVTLGVDTGALHIFDLRTIRAELDQLGLDWNAPPLPSPPATSVEKHL
jgi:WD40 repeat protein